uniref:Uncharacterized protein n=1 Tax=Romanomermis culicivorax TaxID=13658 RepID=A0A915JFE0_ROMCU
MEDQAKQIDSRIRSCLCAMKNVQSELLIGDKLDMIKTLDSILNQLNQIRDIEKICLSGTCFESVRSKIKCELSAKISGEISNLICSLQRYLNDLEFKFRHLQHTYATLCLFTQNMYEEGSLNDENLKSNPVNRSNLADFLSLFDDLILTIQESISLKRSLLTYDSTSTNKMIENYEQCRKIWKNRHRFMHKFNVMYSKFVDY